MLDEHVGAPECRLKLRPFDERAWLATVGYEDEQRDPDDRDWLDRVYAAMMATKSLRVCKALLRGESVHRSQLDPSAVRAIERRSRRS